MSETWFPTPTTPSGRAAGMRQLSRFTAGLSIGAIAATGLTAAAVGVHQLEVSGVQLLPASLTGGGELGGARPAGRRREPCGGTRGAVRLRCAARSDPGRPGRCRARDHRRVVMVAAADWQALGVLVRLVVTDDEALEPARAMLEAHLAALDLACSRFRDDSEVMALERAEGRPMRISETLLDALRVALAAARLTDGDVDPTVGRAMVDLGYDRDLDLLGDVAAPPVVRPAPGWQQIELDPQRRTVRVPPGVLVDLGATAKARAADRAARRLADTLGTGVLVSLGGDVRVAGPAPAGGWVVRVQDRAGLPAEDPRVWWRPSDSPRAASPRRARGRGAGSGPARRCTTSSTRGSGSPRGRPGAP